MCPRMRWRTGARPWIAAQALEAEWKKLFAAYAAAFPELAAEFERTQKDKLQGGMGEGDSELPGGQAGGHAQRRAAR